MIRALISHQQNQPNGAMLPLGEKPKRRATNFGRHRTMERTCLIREKKKYEGLKLEER